LQFLDLSNGKNAISEEKGVAFFAIYLSLPLLIHRKKTDYTDYYYVCLKSRDYLILARQKGNEI
jgi:hypothetical protein